MVAHVEGGFSDGGHAWSNPNLTADYTRAKNANAKWIRTDWDWWAVQDASAAQTPNWSLLDGIVNLCDSLGLKVLPIIHSVPPWANGGLGNYAPPSPLSLWTTFARLAGLRYIPRGLTVWEVGNEPNLAHDGWTIDGGYYVNNMLSPIVAGLRQAATELGVPIQIMFAGLSPTTANPASANVTNFVSAAYTAGAKPLFDIMGFHPYTGTNSPLTAAQMNSEIVALHNQMSAQGDAGKQIWATEYGWGTTPSGDAFAATEAQLAQLALDAATRWSSYSYTGPLFWYSIRDRQTYAANTANREDYFGAWRNDGTPKTGVTTNITQVFAAAPAAVAGAAALSAAATLTATARRTTAGVVAMAAAATLATSAGGGVATVTGAAALTAAATLTATGTTSTTVLPTAPPLPNQSRDWFVEVRLEATGVRFAPLVGWSELVVVDRFNAVGSWQATGWLDDMRPLLTPGVGVVISRAGQQIMSGPVTRIERRGDRTAVVSGVSDLCFIADRVVYPDPVNQISTQTTDYWTSSGSTRETTLLNLIRVNAGSSAQPSRQVARLRLPVTQSRGGAVNVTARLDNLLTLTGTLAEAAGLRLDVQHTEDAAGPHLDVLLTPVLDKSPWVRFGPADAGGPGRMDADWSYAVGAPTVTRALVAGGGEGVLRTFVERFSAAAETLWGHRRVETVIDQRQAGTSTELQTAGDDALAEGSGPVEVNASVMDSPDLGYRLDWTVGDRVGFDLDGETVTDVIREVTTTVRMQSGEPSETIQPTVGSQDATGRTSTVTQRRLVQALRRLAALERRL